MSVRRKIFHWFNRQITAKRLNLTRDEVQIILDGGSVNVKCQEDGVWVSGNIKYVFSGKISSLLFDNSE